MFHVKPEMTMTQSTHRYSSISINPTTPRKGETRVQVRLQPNGKDSYYTVNLEADDLGEHGDKGGIRVCFRGVELWFHSRGGIQSRQVPFGQSNYDELCRVARAVFRCWWWRRSYASQYVIGYGEIADLQDFADYITKRTEEAIANQTPITVDRKETLQFLRRFNHVMERRTPFLTPDWLADIYVDGLVELHPADEPKVSEPFAA